MTKGIQILLCFVGQSKVFEEASETLKKMLNLDISSMQIQRVSEYYGKILDSAVEKNIEVSISKLKETKREDTTYVMVDGGMVYTREEEWKEMKLGRIFKGDNILKMSDKRSEIRQSVYVSHLGGVDKFFPKFERYLNGYKNLVIIGDGAKWIWKWSDDNYPQAIQILDFYHAKEKLVIFAKLFIKDDKERQKWVENQCQKLLENGVEEVIQTIKKLRCKTDELRELKEKTLQYFLEHEDRMLYKTYRDKGLLIGSGPIEAAHRSVIQTRMKLSGQKWSIEGANAIANLRCLYKSNAWNILEKFVNAAA